MKLPQRACRTCPDLELTCGSFQERILLAVQGLYDLADEGKLNSICSVRKFDLVPLDVILHDRRAKLPAADV